MLTTTYSKLALAVLGAALLAGAHGAGRLILPEKTVTVGDTLHVRGTGFAPGTVTLTLRGALDAHGVGSVTIGADSAFALAWPVGRDVRPGVYRLIAIADDGDEITRADVAITESQPEPATEAPSEAHAGHGADGEARADAMGLERRRSGVEWTALLLLWVASVAGGWALMNDSRQLRV
jgi:hypothetical protein